MRCPTVIESKLPVHIADLADPAFRERSPEGSVVDAIGARTYVLVPLLKKDELIGIIGFHRTRVQPFTDAQIALITDFAAQATVALESTRRERRYRETQMELARVNRVATIGQLTASITHEVNQPLAAARNNLTAALNFLDRTPPDLAEVREALACAVKDNDRASTVLGRIRALMQKEPTRTDSVDLNEAVHEVIELTHGEALKHGVSVRNSRTAGLSSKEIGSNYNRSSSISCSTQSKQWVRLLTAPERCLSLPAKRNRTRCASGCETPVPD
jgi:signal transduction histidine kinase